MDAELRERAEHVFCSSHNKETTFLCMDCSVFICDQCVESIHVRHILKALPRTSSQVNYYEILRQRLEVFQEVIKADCDSQLKIIDSHAASVIEVVNKIKENAKESIIKKNNDNLKVLKQIKQQIPSTCINAEDSKDNSCLFSTVTERSQLSEEDKIDISKPFILVQTSFHPSRINVMKIQRQFGQIRAHERELTANSAFIDTWPRLKADISSTTKHHNADKYKGMSSDSDDDFEFM